VSTGTLHQGMENRNAVSLWMAVCVCSYFIYFSKTIFTGLETCAVLKRTRTETAKNVVSAASYLQCRWMFEEAAVPPPEGRTLRRNTVHLPSNVKWDVATLSAVVLQLAGTQFRQPVLDYCFVNCS
jgi:hypothetical protein